MLTQFQARNRKDLMLTNVSMKNMLTQFQVCNRKYLMLPNRSIKSLSRSENTFVSIRGSINNVLTKV